MRAVCNSTFREALYSKVPSPEACLKWLLSMVDMLGGMTKLAGESTLQPWPCRNTIHEKEIQICTDVRWHHKSCKVNNLIEHSKTSHMQQCTTSWSCSPQCFLPVAACTPLDSQQESSYVGAQVLQISQTYLRDCGSILEAIGSLEPRKWA